MMSIQHIAAHSRPSVSPHGAIYHILKGLWLFATFIVLPLAACNDDVFADPIYPEQYAYTLRGEGAECSINFASGSWEALWVKLPEEDSSVPSCYFDVRDHRGGLITQGQSRSARLSGRGYIHVSDEYMSIYFMRDKADRVLVHAQRIPRQGIDLTLSVHSSAGLSESVNVRFEP